MLIDHFLERFRQFRRIGYPHFDIVAPLFKCNELDSVADSVKIGAGVVESLSGTVAKAVEQLCDQLGGFRIGSVNVDSVFDEFVLLARMVSNAKGAL